MKDFQGTVQSNTKVDDTIHVIELSVPDFNGIAEPGQFVMVRTGASYDPFLRRPYSLFDCAQGMIKLLVRVVGKGSARLAQSEPGTTLLLLGPLGNGFPVSQRGAHFLVAGGMGIAPLWFLAHTMEKAGSSYTLIFGDRTHSPLGAMVKARYPDAQLVTDDGSNGIKGFASDALEVFMDKRGEEELTVYGCGPGAMLERLAEISERSGIRTYISLEERMACGMGVCMGCSVKKRDGSGYTRVCRDGPVFPAHEVAW